MIFVKCALAVTAAWLCLGCGCAASNENRAEERSQLAVDRREAWGATFSLPAGWSGGENEAGGFELTDGELALMIGRHETGDGESLEAFAVGRRRSLAELGAAESLEPSEVRIGEHRALVFRGKGGDGVEVRLLVARLNPQTGLSFLLVGEARHANRLDAAWAKLLGTLELPVAPRN